MWLLWLNNWIFNLIQFNLKVNSHTRLVETILNSMPPNDEILLWLPGLQLLKAPSQPRKEVWRNQSPSKIWEPVIYGYNSSCVTKLKGMRNRPGLWLYPWIVLFYKVSFIHQRHSYANYLMITNLMAIFTRKSILIALMRLAKSCFDIGKVCPAGLHYLSLIFFQHDE